MKKFIAVMLSVIMMVMVIPVNVQAADYGDGTDCRLVYGYITQWQADHKKATNLKVTSVKKVYYYVKLDCEWGDWLLDISEDYSDICPYDELTKIEYLVNISYTNKDGKKVKDTLYGFVGIYTAAYRSKSIDPTFIEDNFDILKKGHKMAKAFTKFMNECIKEDSSN